MKQQTKIPNPWEEITVDKRVLDKDKQVIKEYNYKNNKICVGDFPEPFLGNKESDVYLLFGNPGHKEEVNSCEHEYNKDQEELILKNLKHDTKEIKHAIYFFDEIFKEHDGAKWWKDRFKPLIEQIPTSEEIISNKLFCIELYGYHSKQGDDKVFLNLDSAKYTKYIVEKAIDDGKLILICRGVAKWYKLVERLKTYEKCIIVASNQKISISETTISPIAFKKLKEILKENK